MNILELLQGDGFNPVHASGGEYHSACPSCGGRDRLSCCPEKVNKNGRYAGGRYVCRRCGEFGDAVSYLRKFRNIPYPEAFRLLGLQDRPEMPTRDGQHHPKPLKSQPNAKWQATAEAFATHCASQLQRNSSVMAWLQSERGLSVETIAAASLGWHEKDRWQTRPSWGLAAETNPKTGKPKRLWLPAGLVIPCFHDGKINRLRIRRSDPGTGSRYIIMSGSSMNPLTFWTSQPDVVVIESELDALLIKQESGDLCGVATMGSAQAKPAGDLHWRLMAAKTVLVALDNDEAGAQAAWRYWRQFPGFKRWPPIIGKDPTEQQIKAGVSIRSWILAGLRRQIAT